MKAIDKTDILIRFGLPSYLDNGSNTQITPTSSITTKGTEDIEATTDEQMKDYTTSEGMIRCL